MKYPSYFTQDVCKSVDSLPHEELKKTITQLGAGMYHPLLELIHEDGRQVVADEVFQCMNYALTGMMVAFEGGVNKTQSQTEQEAIVEDKMNNGGSFFNQMPVEVLSKFYDGYYDKLCDIEDPTKCVEFSVNTFVRISSEFINVMIEEANNG